MALDAICVPMSMFLLWFSVQAAAIAVTYTALQCRQLGREIMGQEFALSAYFKHRSSIRCRINPTSAKAQGLSGRPGSGKVKRVSCETPLADGMSLLLQEKVCAALPFPSALTLAAIAPVERDSKKKTCLVCSVGTGLFRKSTS